MKYRNKSKSKIIKFLNGKAFYVVAGICFVAIGVAAWSGAEGLRRINDTVDSSRPNASNSSISSDIEHIEVIPPKIDISLPSDTEEPVESELEAVAPPQNEPETEETAAPVAKFFINPVLGDIIKDFSDTELQYSMTMCDMRLHLGVDIAADEGTPVVAAGEGIVLTVGLDTMLGTFVEIDHGNGITAKYYGLNPEPCVKEGDKVDSSKQIGGVGIIPCESVEQRHLHLEFFKDGKSVSALNYIQK